MFHIILFQPEIPPNTGNIIRLCANTGCCLHLIHPMGFQLSDKQLKRAGLDYIDLSKVKQHECFDDFLSKININTIYAYSTKGQIKYSAVSYKPNDAFLFGSETKGLPKDVLSKIHDNNILTLPMIHGSRSMNLSNTVAVVTYEAWRQNNFQIT